MNLKRSSFLIIIAASLLSGCQAQTIPDQSSSSPSQTNEQGDIAQSPSHDSGTPEALSEIGEETMTSGDGETAPSQEVVSGLVRAEALETMGGAFEFTGRARVKGVLQIYWHNDFAPPEGAPNRVLGARFIPGKAQAQALVEFPDDVYDRTPSILILHLGREADTGFTTGLEVSRLAADLVEKVEEVPENFFRYREGHIEQPGVLTFQGLSSLIECDAPYTFVEFESFAPLAMTDETRVFTEHVLAEPQRGGCGSEKPWEESFMLGDGQAIYAEPSEESDILETPSTVVVIKIRTFDDRWIEVYAYGDTAVRGFVRSEALEPVN